MRALLPSKLASLALLLGAAWAAPAQAENKPVEVTWYGHATFLVRSASGTTLLIDPFISQNPKTPADKKDISKLRPDAILVTHSHFDHTVDAVAIAKASKAKVIGAFDFVATPDVPDDQKAGGNVGGVIAVKDVKVHLVPAMHGSVPGGRPLGFVVEFGDGRRLYHTGDTWIFGDMALIEEIHHPDIILLQAGGGPFNQQPEVAKRALDKYFKPSIVVPMHYGTWPVLATEETVKKAFGADPRVQIMQAGQTRTF